MDLTKEEKQKLEYLYKNSLNSVVRTRCLSLLYSNERRSIKEVSQLVHVSRRSLERLFNSWELLDDRYQSVSISKGRGAKSKLALVKYLLPNLVEAHARNLDPILEELQTKHNI